MYLYDELDRILVAERVAEFRDQVRRRLSGELTEDEFKPLRLMNGIYLQLHAYMARISIPYGTLSSDQLRMLAHVGRRYDRGYGHFTTRQNIQFHWIKLEDLPDVMADLARVGLHGMQTSGNCVRNVTTDQWAGVAPGEVEDPRIWAELLRQHCTLHPEFTFLPRKFKIALTASAHDRAAVKIHDVGLLQSRRPARQHLQGAHQDPGPRSRRRGVCQGSRGRVAADQGRPAGARSGRPGRCRRAVPLSRLREARG
jgi:sulfite reductase (NADPH) hemoprotein beta-component